MGLIKNVSYYCSRKSYTLVPKLSRINWGWLVQNTNIILYYAFCLFN